jgi:DNA-directed RNA polymerase subunit K/omega
MKVLVDSRTSQMNLEECVEHAGNNRYDLVLIASQRLRELRRQHKESGRYISCIDALQDIQDGKVNAREYLNKV